MDIEFYGVDCSVPIGTPPTLLEYMSPTLCNIQERPCEVIRILADNLVNSEDLTCRLEGEQVKGL